MARKPSGLSVASTRPMPAEVPAAPPARSQESSRGKGRQGKKMVAGWFDTDAVIQLQILAAKERTTVQNLLGEAPNMLFRARALPLLARIEREDAA